VRSVQTWLLQGFLRKVGATIIHSHLVTSDIVSARAGRRVGVPVTTTMHGDHSPFEHSGSYRSARIRNFPKVLRELDRSLSAVVCITDAQRASCGRYFPRLTAMGRVRKIYNGYTVHLLRLDRGSGAGDRAKKPLSARQTPLFCWKTKSFHNRGIILQPWDLRLRGW